MRDYLVGKPDPYSRYGTALATLVVGLAYTFGPHRWFLTNAFQALHFLHISLWVYGVILLVSAVLQVMPNPQTRFVGFLLGAVTFSSLFLTLLFSWVANFNFSPSNWALLGFVAYWLWVSAHRVSMVVRERK